MNWLSAAQLEMYLEKKNCSEPSTALSIGFGVVGRAGACLARKPAIISQAASQSVVSSRLPANGLSTNLASQPTNKPTIHGPRADRRATSQPTNH